MRVSTLQMQQQGINAMLDRNAALAETQLQLATGRRIIRPSDDPVGATKVLPLRELVERISQFSKNSDAAESRLSLGEGALTSVTNVLTRVMELTVQANSDSVGPQDRINIALELRENLAEMMALANATDSNGEYLFAGDNVDTLPFTESPAGTFNYTGDNGQRNVQIGEDRQIAVGDPGDDVFINIAFSGGGNQSMFKTLYDYIVGLESNTTSTVILDDLQAAHDNVLSVRAALGARFNAIESYRDFNDELVNQSQQTLSGIEDLDMAEAISRLNVQLLGLQASQQVFAQIQNLSLFNFL
ncbi:MAG: flagellar hook-associated protein 3 [Gammaproteobacteria bacterium]|nr:flagellar hook-associated protein 3 [Gammaproteobacteria bacterium]